MQIKEDFIVNNFNSKVSRDIKYIVIHYTAGVSSKPGRAKSTRDYFNRAGVQASAHYIVDDETIIHAVKDKDVAWHCGTKGTYKHDYCRNGNSIGIEVCSNHDTFKSYEANPATDKGWYFTKESLELTAELVRYLMDKYNIDIENVLMHYDVTGKWCPAPLLNGVGFTWGEFLDMVEKELSIPDYAKEAVEWYINSGYLKGKENGLGLSEDMVRLLVIFYRIFKDKGWV